MTIKSLANEDVDDNDDDVDDDNDDHKSTTTMKCARTTTGQITIKGRLKTAGYILNF